MSMAAYITSDLTAQLRSGEPLVVTELTLDSLAAYYKVSYTPVRMAINELVSEGLLVRGSNRRLKVAAHQRRRSSKSPSLRPERPRDLFKVVSTDLVQVSLKGEAVFLREEVTAEKYGVSRTVIRNILHRLAGEGLLEHLPRRGWRLKAFQMDDLRAFTDVREVLELKALELARPKLVAADLQRMLEANAPPRTTEELPRSDESLHEYFITLAANPHIRSFLEGPASRFYRLLLKWEEAYSSDVASKVAEEHRRILEALLTRNWRGARQALSDHIRGNNRFWDELVEIMRNRNFPIEEIGIHGMLQTQFSHASS
ncbi:MAG: GntR family transcriptional regulator, partial [Planctomycetaceae bacterium]|nr:GntR family transcriptional regulator [Planctomycetaceae bacterium]